MTPDLLPSLVAYYQQVQCTKEIETKIALKRQKRASSKAKSVQEVSAREKSKLCLQIKDLRTHLTGVQADVEQREQELETMQTRLKDNDKSGRKQIEELNTKICKLQATAEVRQREVESIKTRQSENDKAERTLTETLKVQAESYKRELSEVRTDIKLRDEELKGLQQDALERDADLREVRDASRTKDRELKELRDQLRVRESEVRKANHWIEKLHIKVERLELDLSSARDALEAAHLSISDVEERLENAQAQNQLLTAQQSTAAVALKRTRVAPSKPSETSTFKASPNIPTAVATETCPSPIGAQIPDSILAVSSEDKKKTAVEPVRDHSAVEALAQPKKAVVKTKAKPVRQDSDSGSDSDSEVLVSKKKVSAKAKPATQKTDKPKQKKGSSKAGANKENLGGKRKRPVDMTDFSASPPRSSPPPASPKPRAARKPDFSMTPFVDKTKGGKLSLPIIALSPNSPELPRSRKSIEIDVPGEPAPVKKKRKLLGGTKTLMDDTPKMTKKVSTNNFGKDLSPLKRPSSGISLTLN